MRFELAEKESPSGPKMVVTVQYVLTCCKKKRVVDHT